ncbi:aromatic amino acid hydroxylase [Tumebacillus algifaecis]|uniref:aromatic amino acid hydroxylase n=1 Tax=Tumebacillus algifaecis TaxID=1214604 RepID=UPI0012FD77ED|nr:aromatic amino acid hydroxylase [Tumebacillus algifaecis]
MKSHSTTTAALIPVPPHLTPFCVEQNYDKYSPIDHAVWRYVLRQNSAFLAEKGYGSYEDGMRVTGMSTESVPNIEQMNLQLSKMGWGAVAIDGFIPPVAFFDFQAHRLLPIAGDIRTLDHIAYTPAPDIIHESAGHAPMLHDPGYAEFLQFFGEIGAKALASKEDHDLYEAIRLLSIVKEDPRATALQVEEAEENLKRAEAAVIESSEAGDISKLYWWTVEYGLIGSVSDPKIYGAGLLSSMGESRALYRPHVQKVAFDLHTCSTKDYNITEPQPQLYVCENFDQLTEAVKEFAKTMAYQVGGTVSLKKALRSDNLATAVYSSGLQVSGTFTHLEYDAQGEAVYLKTTGPTMLAVANQMLSGHDLEYHGEGFGSPIGLIKGHDTPLEDFSDTQLDAAGLQVGNVTDLTFVSGVTVSGEVTYILREAGKIVLIGFDNCTVTHGDHVLFQAEWGTFDMAVGAVITSVYAGAADRAAWASSTFTKSALNTQRHEVTADEQKLYDLYQSIRNLREANSDDSGVQDLTARTVAVLDEAFPNDWLLRVEILELLAPKGLAPDLQAHIEQWLNELAATDEGLQELIENGINLAR